MITDYLVPDAGGVSLLHQLQAEPNLQSLPVVLLSSAGTLFDRTTWQQMGFARCQSKPVRTRTLQETLLALLQERRGLAPAALPQLHLRVLVAEDNVVNQRVVRGLLEKLGCSVGVAANGSEAVAMWRAFPWDIVLMDCHMPEMDGFQATRAIRGIDPGHTTQIIDLTANALREDREACIEAGMNDHVTKPVGLEQLNRALHSAASRRVRPG